MVRLTGAQTDCNSIFCLLLNPPVGQRHALKELRQGSINREMRRASLSEVIRLAGLFIYSVEVVTFLWGVVGMRRRHHKMTAVDNLRLASIRFLKRNGRFLSVRVVVLLLLDYHRGPSVLHCLSSSHIK